MFTVDITTVFMGFIMVYKPTFTSLGGTIPYVFSGARGGRVGQRQVHWTGCEISTCLGSLGPDVTRFFGTLGLGGWDWAGRFRPLKILRKLKWVRSLMKIWKIHTKLQDQWISVIYDDICNIFSSILRCHHLHYGLGFFCLGKGGLYSSLGKFSNSCWIV